MFCEEIRTKDDLSYISICSLSILYYSKIILMATSVGTNICRCNEGSLYIKSQGTAFPTCACVPSEYLDQPAHRRSLIIVFPKRFLVDSEASDSPRGCAD